MAKLLEKVFEQASKLPAIEQNALAKWLVKELESERKWNQVFTESEDILDQLANEALESHRRGKTTLLDIEKL